MVGFANSNGITVALICNLSIEKKRRIARN
jgi:hypothetical protein